MERWKVKREFFARTRRGVFAAVSAYLLQLRHALSSKRSICDTELLNLSVKCVKAINIYRVSNAMYYVYERGLVIDSKVHDISRIRDGIRNKKKSTCYLILKFLTIV